MRHLTKNKVNASASGRSSSLLTILFHTFLLAGSQEKHKKNAPRPPLFPSTSAFNFTVRSQD